jgi:hypothetical protein
MSRTDKQDKIHALYKVLLLFEDLTSLEPTIEEADYTTYCERLSVRFRAVDGEISDTLAGLSKMGLELTHPIIRSCVLRMTNRIERMGD